MFTFPDHLKFASLSPRPYPTKFPLREPGVFDLAHGRSSSINDGIVFFKDWLYELYTTIEDAKVSQSLIRFKQELLSAVHKKQEEIHEFKAGEWSRQLKLLAGQQKVAEAMSSQMNGPVIIPTGKF